MTDNRTASIPFAGFYNSWHDTNLDSALEQMFQDDSGDTTPAYDIAHDAIDWRAAHLAYAQKYCVNLALDDWEAPQLSLLIECYVMARLGEYHSDVQWWLNYECNGDVTRCIESAIPSDAWDKINELERAA